jgi:DNA modification methylase
MATRTLPNEPTVVFLHGDAAHLDLPDASVDLIVTSPPYFALRDYKDCDGSVAGQIGAEATPRAFLAALWACMDEWWRVLAPGGSVWVNLGDKYNSAASGQHSGSLGGGDAAKRANGRGSSYGTARTKSLMGLPWRFALGCVDPAVRAAIENPALLASEVDHPQWILRAEVIWAKPNGLPESVRDRVARKHENWFHFTKSERYFTAVDLIREPHTATVTGRDTSTWKQGPSGQNRGTNVTAGRISDLALNTLGKLPGSVWSVATEPLRVPDHLTQHFAAFPSEFPRRIVLGWAPTRGICVECGEGRRPVVAKDRVVLSGPPAAKPAQAQLAHGRDSRNNTSAITHTTITGYACACYGPALPDTRPAVVLDPFGGTGTTAIVAEALGCVGITNDLSEAYIELAKWRREDGRLAAKVLERTNGTPAKPKRKAKKAEPPAPGQLPLEAA